MLASLLAGFQMKAEKSEESPAKKIKTDLPGVKDLPGDTSLVKEICFWCELPD